MPDYDPIHLTYNDKPRAIVAHMDGLAAQGKRVDEFRKQRRWIPWLLFWVGFPLILIDLAILAFGYRVCIFSLAAPVCWVAAVVMGLSQRRARGLKLPPQFFAVRQILHTLRDDADPKRNFFGHLDLTGPQQKEKIARETSDSQGRVTEHYRDEWLSIKAKLFDGNMLRFSAITRKKIRKGFWKRSAISGKMKWKAEKYKGTLQELRVKLSVNPEVYAAAEGAVLLPGTRVGAYAIKKFMASGGIIDLVAYFSGERVSPNDVLGVLRSVYDLLERRTV